ncbi:hypothetical protein COCC4DRAFT_32974 [Bipolaris maydis ATCC 48331]|uniref:Bacteriocin-protection protein, YdeI/OmpD-associated family n=3 Tax=Cochliobolus heterostrophus TaxID=5016 RepID=M2VAJ4_COCH5|nr:uncharacterized protein COCC4DRAFT_32974 [Bipolaris maydis ATCC 48331]EMD96972.1 hypothetical protein COCHEDRAFT_1018660 [Bipolaris maydis C5]ENI03842.1 hypothetical protein COCC4DRAFT_32974 [Bipolaris maydis ATCC 48331]KAH7558078.1 hypothetical protein BM1_05350 [Bipolaris maydis]KAJ6211601.1 hypothetical protein PSV09DRAFT_1018660 [Bipolaris maydis]
MTAHSQDPEFPTQAFATPADFELFLDREHITAPGIFVKFAKKSSGIPSITAAEAVEVALCYGWIDGRANSIDDTWWKIRYTPRRAKSIWSKKNVGTVARLIEEGRMRPAGLAAVDAAKADGRWDRAYAGPATIVVPDDFKIALAKVPAAKTVWESMNKSEQFPTLLRVETGTHMGRSKRIDAVVQTLATGRRPGSSTAAKASRKTTSGESDRVQKPSTNQGPRREGPRKRKS